MYIGPWQGYKLAKILRADGVAPSSFIFGANSPIQHSNVAVRDFKNTDSSSSKVKQIQKVIREIKAKKARKAQKPIEITVNKEKDRGLKVVHERDWPMVLMKDETIEARIMPIRGFPGLIQSRRGLIYDLPEKSTCHYCTFVKKNLMLLQAAQLSQIKPLQPELDQNSAGKLKEKTIRIKANKIENQGNVQANLVGGEPMEGVEESMGCEDTQGCEEPMDIDG